MNFRYSYANRFKMTKMMTFSTKQDLIAQIGQTDQLFLHNNTPELALQRGQLRLELLTLSQQHGEKIYFLQQAIGILEQARLYFHDMPQTLFIELSIVLTQSYIIYFQLTQQQPFLLIAQQIIKPLSHHQQLKIYQLLREIAQLQQQPAMEKYWQQKIEKWR